MKWPLRQPHKLEISVALANHSEEVGGVPGIADARAREALAMQIVASLRREEYFRRIQQRGPIQAARADPHSASFEAELGVVHFLQTGQRDEAAWLIFLMVYLAKPEGSGWTRLRDIYGIRGQGRWTWNIVSADPQAFEHWLAENWQTIRGKFGNHRKYASIRAGANGWMGPAVTRYIQWVNEAGGHDALFGRLIHEAGNDPHSIFDRFYKVLPVKGFGRLGRFDWVAMLARYGFMPAEAGSAYLKGATGPVAGIKLLFANNPEAKLSLADMQQRLDALDGYLGVGMEVLEDAICNWQKTQFEFKHFKG